ncbi:hypothetical protein [Streptomyces sp. NPDC096132]|uniref:hypothetical protein n=1 Tax=Streptomyces sp. NPDC096132 TaxID=3366075 RepID=UPI00382A8776
MKGARLARACAERVEEGVDATAGVHAGESEVRVQGEGAATEAENRLRVRWVQGRPGEVRAAGCWGRARA